MNRVRFLIVYLGCLPPWLPAFLVSCRYNPDFDWLVLTDQQAPGYLPENVSFGYINEGEVRVRCLDVLGIRYPEGASPGKLTDLHPAFGKLFADFFSGYEFWGHCDLDQVWGDISHFIPSSILDRNDIVSSRRHRITGHFTLFRNCATINDLYQDIPDYALHCENETCARLDEKLISRFLNWNFNRRRHRLFRKLTLGFIPYGPRIHWEAYLAPTGAEQKKGAYDLNGSMRWAKGKTYDFDGRETMYLHFHKMKQTMSRFEVGYGDDPCEFWINREGIVTAPSI